MTRLFTIGVYGRTEREFFDTLQKARIDTFCDIRDRRGVRGAEYAFVNSARLQAKLARLGIAYHHFRELAQDAAARAVQLKEDAAAGKGQRTRVTVGEAFKAAYAARVLARFDTAAFVERLGGARRVVLFCVEGAHTACHRSLLAERIQADAGVPVTHL